ncbi:hypothetical protein GCM10009633_11940 [Janibacter melonis]
MRALSLAMSLDPAKAPSIRAKASRAPPGSTTATFIAAPIEAACDSAASTAARAPASVSVADVRVCAWCAPLT